jgi:hypothetical protein
VVEVPRAALRDALNDDAEFRHAARYWDASLRLGIGGESLCVRIEDGRVADVRPSASGDPVSVAIDGPVAEWEKLLAPVPRPFYQSVYAAAIHHGIQFSGDPVDMYAYLGAVTRLVDVLREQVEIQ